MSLQDGLKRADELRRISLDRWAAYDETPRSFEGQSKAARLTKDEACEVYDTLWEFLSAHPEAKGLIDCVRKIEAELTRGWRCPVCFAVDDPACIEGC